MIPALMAMGSAAAPKLMGMMSGAAQGGGGALGFLNKVPPQQAGGAPASGGALGDLAGQGLGMVGKSLEAKANLKQSKQDGLMNMFSSKLKADGELAQTNANFAGQLNLSKEETIRLKELGTIAITKEKILANKEIDLAEITASVKKKESDNALELSVDIQNTKRADSKNELSAKVEAEETKRMSIKNIFKLKQKELEIKGKVALAGGKTAEISFGEVE